MGQSPRRFRSLFFVGARANPTEIGWERHAVERGDDATPDTPDR
jgi:hypothetical protein